MENGRLLISIDFNQHESSWIVIALNEIEASDTRFLKAAARIFDGRLNKCIQKFGFDMNIYMHYQHEQLLVIRKTFTNVW